MSGPWTTRSSLIAPDRFRSAEGAVFPFFLFLFFFANEFADWSSPVNLGFDLKEIAIVIIQVFL